ncbi:TetR/AcrR family transcriptional regulator [Oribacterium sp. P6A1]|uniref:TetR/AcrR family transcriptional regulator n=1 Tax=Oribacterium sp. P6A1 TaxID=1410612 RepID=UPI00068F443C|nr:TetR/AcrR family transcriptional regulator [Oribacterium sp. P6A1]
MNNSKETLQKTTKEKISDKAFQLFKEHGYDNVSVRQIAAELDITTGALYYHFKNKADIIINRTVGNEDIIRQKAYDPSIPTRKGQILSLFTTLIADFILFEGPEICAIRMWGRDLNINRSKSLEETLTNLVSDAINKKELSSEYTPEIITNSILYTFRGIAYCWATGKEQFDIRSVLESEISKVLSFYSMTA